MKRGDKEQVVGSLRRVFDETAGVVVAHYSGLTVAQMTSLRSRVRQAGGRLKVAKNRLARRALAETKFRNLSDLFTGPTAFAYSSDPIAVAKAAVEFAKLNDKLKILGGEFGDRMFDAEGIKAVASLPPLAVLRAKIAGLLISPPARIASILEAPAAQLARVLAAHARGREAA